MGNTIKEFKFEISKIQPDTDEAVAKRTLTDWIDGFIKSRIILADEAICESVIKKINDGDVILTYGYSHVVISAFKKAKELGKKFKVVVVDGRPHYDGKRAANELAAEGILGTYVLISQTCYIMKEVTKVFLGAHAFMSNGYLMSRVGTSVVAMAAKANGQPVMVCCESYKFCEKVTTDSVVMNELGDPETLVPIHTDTDDPKFNLEDWQSRENLTLLNIMYDFTPPNFIDAVVTEMGIIPCTSVPVVIREYSAHLMS